MEITTSAEFGRKIGHYQDRALVEPVMVTRNGRERVVLLSADEYKRLKRRIARSLLFAGLVLVVLNFLFCMAYVLLNLAQQTAPL